MVVSPQRLTRWPSYVRDRHAAITYTTPRDAPFPHSPARLTAATTDLYSAAINGRMTHSGNTTLAAHIAAAVLVEAPRGMRLSQQPRSRTAPKIDLAACLVMAHSRATWRATHKKRKKTRSFAA